MEVMSCCNLDDWLIYSYVSVVSFLCKIIMKEVISSKNRSLMGYAMILIPKRFDCYKMVQSYDISININITKNLNRYKHQMIRF